MVDEGKNIGQSILSGLLLALLILPPILILIRKSSRLWIKGGIEAGPGQDKAKLELVEIWEMFFIFSAFVCLLILVYMVVNFTIYNTDYPWQLYALSFTGSLGSNAAGLILAYIKSKKGLP